MKLTTLLVAVTCVTTAAAAAAAQNAGPDLTRATLEDLMSVTITTATRSAEGLAQAPALVRVVTEQQIERRGYRSLADILKDVPEFKVDIAGDQDYPTELTVQGTRGASRVIVLLDGIRISSPTNEPLPILANYPVHSARQIEILFGPASALYGADAFSAVINIITRDGADAPGFSVSTSGGQFGLFNQTMSYGTRVGRNGSLLVAGQIFYDRQPDLSRYYPADFGGLQAQRTGVFNTIFGPMVSARPVSPDYDIPVSAHSLQATLRAGGFQFTLFQSHSRESTAVANTPDNTVYNDAAFNRNTLLVGAVAYPRQVGGVTSTTTMTASRHELDPQSGYWNVYSNLEKSFKYAYGSMLQADEKLSWRAGARTSITAGATVERFFSIPQGADLNAPIVSQDQPGTMLGTNIVDDFYKIRYMNTGAYGQIQYGLTPTVTATLGGRADYNTRFGATVNPRAGIVVQPRAGTTLKLLYGTAYLAPSPYQEYSHYGSFSSTDGGATYRSDYWHVPNPTLKPQRKETLEANLLQTLQPFVISVSAFYSRFSDLIVEADTDMAQTGTYKGWPVAYVDFPANEGRQTTYGGTLGVDVVKTFGREGRIEGRAAISVADGHVWNDEDSTDGRLHIGGMVPLQMRLGVDVDLGKWSLAPRLAIVGTQRVFATAIGADGSPVRRTIDGYSTMDVHLRRRRVFKGLDAFLAIENLLDARYRDINGRAFINPEELVGAPQNPRRITAGFEIKVR